jgi:hypothetical protein
MNIFLALVLVLLLILVTSTAWPPKEVVYIPTAQLSYTF